MRIDFRMRPPFKSFLDTFMFDERPPQNPIAPNALTMNLPYYRSFADRSMDAFLEEMDEARIDMGVIVGRIAPERFGSVKNEDVAELVSLYPDRFVGFGSLDLEAGNLAAQVDAAHAMGLRGLGLDSPWCGFYDDDPRLFPMYERAQELGLIAMITSSVYLGEDLTYSDPVHIQRVAKAFPNLTIVISHGCWPWTAQSAAVAFAHPNVYLMPDLYWNVPSTPGAHEWVNAANYYLSYRILHGSAYPVRSLGDSIEGLLKLGFASTEIAERILGGNAARLLGLDESAARFPATPVELIR